MSESRPFAIFKHDAWRANKQAKEKRGAAGVDGPSIEEFEQNLPGNLYKLWNRMTSGSCLPRAARRLKIPKAPGGMRPLGIPTVVGHIAQIVIGDVMEPKLEPYFRTDS